MEDPIGSLPGVSRWSVDLVAARARRGRRCWHSLRCPVPEHAARTPQRGTSAEALNPDDLMCRAIKAIKDACGEKSLGDMLTDVALRPVHQPSDRTA
jgi:porphobilinogen synthase